MHAPLCSFCFLSHRLQLSNINNLQELAKVAEMEAKSSPRTFTQCFPPCKWIKSGELDALLVDVSGNYYFSPSSLLDSWTFNTSPRSNSGLGFKKEDLKVQANTSGKLSVSGECAVEGNQWRRFLKTFQLPKDCNVREIQANLDKETLYVILPKPADKIILRDPRKRKTLILSTAVVTVLAAALGTYLAYKILQ